MDSFCVQTQIGWPTRNRNVVAFLERDHCRAISSAISGIRNWITVCESTYKKTHGYSGPCVHCYRFRRNSVYLVVSSEQMPLISQYRVLLKSECFSQTNSQLAWFRRAFPSLLWDRQLTQQNLRRSEACSPECVNARAQCRDQAEINHAEINQAVSKPRSNGVFAQITDRRQCPKRLDPCSSHNLGKRREWAAMNYTLGKWSIAWCFWSRERGVCRFASLSVFSWEQPLDFFYQIAFVWRIQHVT